MNNIKEYLLIFFITIVNGCSLFAQEFDLNLHLSVHQKEIEVRDPIYATLTLYSTGKSSVKLNEPALHSNIEFDIISDGDQHPQVEYLTDEVDNAIVLNANDSIVINVELNRLFPVLIESGIYTVTATYFIDVEKQKKISSNEVKFSIKKLKKEDVEVSDLYMKFSYGSPLGKIKYGKEILDKYPDCSFIKEVLIEMGSIYMLTEEYDKAIELFDKALGYEEKTSEIDKRELIYKTAWGYYLSGDTLNAIKKMEQLGQDDPQGNKYVRKWRSELTEKK